MVGKNHEHCNDAQQFYAGITPPFEIRVGGTALWEAIVSEPIIILLRFLLLSYLFPTPHSRGASIRLERPSHEVSLRSSTEPQAAGDFWAFRKQR